MQAVSNVGVGAKSSPTPHSVTLDLNVVFIKKPNGFVPAGWALCHPLGTYAANSQTQRIPSNSSVLVFALEERPFCVNDKLTHIITITHENRVRIPVCVANADVVASS